MKKLFTILAVVAMFTLTVTAQSFKTFSTSTNRVSGTNTTPSTPIPVVADTAYIAFWMTGATNNVTNTIGSAGTVILKFKCSMNQSSDYFSHPSDTNFSIGLTTANTSSVTSQVQVLDMSMFSWIKQTSIETTSTNLYASNITAVIWWKKN